MTGLWLGLLAVVLAGPVPALLARAQWPARVPRPAVVLWQAVALSAVLALFGAGFATSDALARHIVVPARRDGFGVGALLDLPATQLVQLAAATAITAAVLAAGAHLNVAGVRIAIRLRSQRGRHRDVVDLLHEPTATPALGATDVRVLAAPGRHVYCVPGRHPRVVVSADVAGSLTEREIEAVLAHERAHLRARHDLLLEFFTVLHEAFPRVVRSRAALHSVHLLVEMLADDAAGRRHGAGSVMSALVSLGDAGGTSIATDIGARLRRLADGGRRGARPLSPRATSAAVYSCALGLLVVPTTALAAPWLLEVWSAL